MVVGSEADCQPDGPARPGYVDPRHPGAYNTTQPRRAPDRTASVRLVTPSLAYSEERWNLTVFSLMSSAAAICLLASPRAVNCNTWCSRSVNGSKPSSASSSGDSACRSISPWTKAGEPVHSP